MFPQTETFEHETVSRVIFMQDGAPPHFSCFVTDVLNDSLMPGLEGMDQYPGQLETQISIFFSDPVLIPTASRNPQVHVSFQFQIAVANKQCAVCDKKFL
jgi:hypothetical protein